MRRIIQLTLCALYTHCQSWLLCFLCIFVFPFVYADSGASQLPLFKPGHYLTESANNFFNMAGPVGGKPWSLATECEQLPALYQVFSSAKAKVYFSEFSPPEERQSGLYVFSHENGAGFRVVWQLRVDDEGNPTDAQDYHLISVLTFWDYDFTNGKLKPISGIDSLRIRTESWSQMEHNSILGQSYFAAFDDADSMTHLEGGSFHDDKGIALVKNITEVTTQDSCQGCHHGERTKVIVHKFGEQLDKVAGFKVFKSYVLGSDVTELLKSVHVDLDEAQNSLMKRHNHGVGMRPHRIERVLTPQARRAAFQLVEDMRSEDKVKTLFKPKGILETVEKRWSELKGKGLCQEPVDSFEKARLFSEHISKLNTDTNSNTRLSGLLSEYTKTDAAYLKDDSGRLVTSPISGDYATTLRNLKLAQLDKDASVVVKDFKFLRFVDTDAAILVEYELFYTLSGEAQSQVLKYELGGLLPQPQLKNAANANDWISALLIPKPKTYLIQTVEPTTDSIQKNLINVACLRCHNSTVSAGNLDLSDLKSLVSQEHEDEDDVMHMDLNYIEPGSPEDSLIYRKIMSESGKMPPPESSGPHLTPAAIAAFRSWIEDLPFELANTGPQPGKYFGYVQVSGRKEVIHAQLDLFVIDDGTSYEHLEAHIKLSFGGPGSTEYLSQYYDEVRYSVERDELYFFSSEADSAETIILEQVRIIDKKMFEGVVTSISADISGSIKLWWKEIPKLSDKLVLAASVSDTYEGLCRGTDTQLQVQAARWHYQPEGLQLDQIMKGYHIASWLSVGKPAWRKEIIIKQTEYDPFRAKLKLITRKEFMECGVSEAGVKCSDGCFYKRQPKQGGDLGFVSKVPQETKELPIWQDKEISVRPHNKEIDGKYCGWLSLDQIGKQQYLCVNLRDVSHDVRFDHNVETSLVSANATLHFGTPKTSKDGVTFVFARRPFLRKTLPHLTFKSHDDVLMQIRRWGANALQGIWFSKSFGRVGSFHLEKEKENNMTTVKQEEQNVIPTLTGSFKGPLHQLDIAVRELNHGSHFTVTGNLKLLNEETFGFFHDIKFGSYDFYSNSFSLLVRFDDNYSSVISGETTPEGLQLFYPGKDLMTAFAPKSKLQVFRRR